MMPHLAHQRKTMPHFHFRPPPLTSRKKRKKGCLTSHNPYTRSPIKISETIFIFSENKQKSFPIHWCKIQVMIISLGQNGTYREIIFIGDYSLRTAAIHEYRRRGVGRIWHYCQVRILPKHGVTPPY